MTRTLVASILGLGLLVAVPAGSAFAQRAAKKDPAAAAAPASATKREHNYEFDADNIDGELVKPEGEFMNARKFAEHGSLIKIRTDFIREIVKSAEDL